MITVNIKSLALNIVIATSICIFIVSSIMVYTTYNYYNKGNAVNDDMLQYITYTNDNIDTSDVLTNTKLDSSESNDNIIEITSVVDKPGSTLYNLSNQPLVVDFESLKVVNNDIIAWVSFGSGSTINYPVVKSKDNNDYLHTDIKGNDSIYGTIFTDMDNSEDFTDKNTILYGHNMRNGTMFGMLSKFLDVSYFNNNSSFSIYLPDGSINEYLIFSVNETAIGSWYYQTEFQYEGEYEFYLKSTIDNTVNKRLLPSNDSGDIVTLSTCTSNGKRRIVVQGVKL